MDEPRWLADEMVGRLARYLRFFGHDTEYVRGLGDEEILRWAVRDRRTILTRDRQLARRAPDALWLESAELGAQLRAVRAARPDAGYELRFDRCTQCNGALRRLSGAAPEGVPARVRERAVAVYACTACGHLYWEGTHTARIRSDLARTWAQATP